MLRLLGPSALLVVLLAASAAFPSPVGGQAAGSPSPGTWEDLVTLFREWRAFEAPRFVDGVPDYTADAMAAQRAALPEWQARLEALDPSGRPVPQQVDWWVVKAEMNGLDFDHRVRRPWQRDPTFYVMVYPSQSDVPAHEGAVIHGWIDLWTYDYPLSDDDAAELAARIGTIPAVLEQARGNLTGNARDLWLGGIWNFRDQAESLARFGERVAGTSADLDAAVERARDASLAFADWLEAEAPSKTGPSGIGRENYTWLMRNVHLVPYSWEELETLMERELGRAWASLKEEEHRNRGLPEQVRIDDRETFERRSDEAVDTYMRFLEEEDIHAIRPWMRPALEAKEGRFTPVAPGAPRSFFSEVDYRDPLVMQTHKHHWIELARIREAPHPDPIRAVAPLFNIYDHRSEGFATWMEETMMRAGLFDDRPRSRELVWILVAQRAARALSGLRIHANEYDMQQAVAHAMEWTPRGWLTSGDLVRFEQLLYLRQPGYGTSYLSGKAQLDELVMARAHQQGEDFTLGGFIDGLFATGVVPVSLARWEMTGEKPAFLEGL